jgi:hypothetical protein
MCKLYFCRIVPETQCQVAMLSRAMALVLRQTGVSLVHSPHSSLVMVICSLVLILGHLHIMGHLNSRMVAILQQLVAIKLGGNNHNNNLNRHPLVPGMTIIANNSSLNSSLPLELLHLPMLLAIIMASLLHMLHKVMVILPILSRVDNKHMDMTVTLAIRTKGSSRVTLSRLVTNSRATTHLLMDQLQIPLKMDLLPAMAVLVGPASHPQGSKIQHQLLEVTLAILANLQPVLRQATQGKDLLHQLAMVLHRNLAMAPNWHRQVVMV